MKTCFFLSLSFLIWVQQVVFSHYSIRKELLLMTISKSLSFSSVQLLSHVRFFVTRWTAAHQASLSLTNSWSLLILMSIESVVPSNHLILCRSLLLLPSIFPSVRVFSKESVLQCSTFFLVQFSRPHMTTRKTIALTIRTFVLYCSCMLSLFSHVQLFVAPWTAAL